MPLTFKIVTQQLNSTGTQDFTYPGFGTPLGAIVLLADASVLATKTDHNNFSLGFTDLTNQLSLTQFNRGLVSGSTRTAWQFRNTRLGSLNNAANDWNEKKGIVLDSAITDGIRINNSVGSSSGHYCAVVLIGGSGNVHVGTVAIGAQDVAVNYTGASFAPTSMLGLFNSRNLGTGLDTAYFSLGAYDGTNQNAWLWRAIDGRWTPSAGTLVSGQISNDRIGWGATPRISVEAFLADGFTVYQRDSSDLQGDDFGFMLLDGSPMHVGNTTYAPNGTQLYNASGGLPIFGIELSTLITGAINTWISSTEAEGYGIGLYDGSSEFSLWNKEGYNVDPTEAAHWVRNDAVVDMFKASDVADGRLSFNSFSSDGRLLDQDAAPGAAKRYFVIHFLSQEASGGAFYDPFGRGPFG